MNLSWIESVLFGLFSGFVEILPVSARAHSILLLKLLGEDRISDLLLLLIHFSILGATYYSFQTQLVRVSRALRLARIPKKRRKRPLDTQSLMDFRLWRTMIIPVVLAFIFYNRLSVIENSLLWIAILMFLNGIVLYVPQFLPGSNKDSRLVSRVEALLMGLGGALSVLPGMSGVAGALSVGAVCGVDRSYSVGVVMLMNMAVTVCLAVYDVLGILSNGIGALSFTILLKYILASGAAFLSTVLAIKIMRTLAKNIGFNIFVYYCWGIALFTFIINLVA